MKLSVCMMVKNEEKNLKRCLDKLKPLVESKIAELIIVDTGSTDNTELIAREYTDKVYFHQWNKNFSEMRNISISYAKGEWVFIIDADERLDDVEKLITLMNSVEINKFNTIILQIKNLYDPLDENKYNLIVSPRIFRNNSKFRYEGAVHNQPIFKGPNLSVDINLTHFGYIATDKELMEIKYKRTTELLKSELEKDPENLYYIYQLGVSYDMHSDHKDALNEFRKAYDILKSKSLDVKKVYIYIYASYARIAYTNNEFRETIKIAKEALALSKDYVDLYYLLGISEKQLNNNEDSFEYFNKYIKLVKRFYQLDISKDMSIIMYHIDEISRSTAYFEISKYYLDLFKYKNVYEIYNNITNINEKIYISIKTLIPLEKYSELRVVYNKLISSKDKNSFLCTLEENIKKLEDKQKINLCKEFQLNEDSYGLLNKIRISNNTDEKIRFTKLLINEIDFNKEPLFYSEIFENVKEDIKLIIDAFNEIELWNLNDIIKFLVEEKGFKEIFESYILENNINIKNLKELRVITLIATILMALYIKNNNEICDKYLNVFKVYIKAGINFISQLYQVNNVKMIYKSVINEEDRFFMVMFMINNCLQNDDKKSAVKYMIEAVNLNKALSKYIDIYKDEIFNIKETNLIKEEKEQFESFKLKVKENINSLISDGNLNEAKKLIAEYEEIVKQDIEIYSMKAVICILENKLEDAEYILKSGLEIDDKNFDLTYNLAYLHEQAGKFSEAIECYIKSKNYCNDYNVKKEIDVLIDNIREKYPNLIIKPKEKIAFFIKQGMDSFLGDVIDGLSQEYDTKKIIVTEYKQIDEGMEWADICWFEWCDELVQYGSKHKLAIDKKIVCRLHSYEAFAGYASNVKWDTVDKLIFVGENIREFTINKFHVDKNKTMVIPNGVNINKYKFNERKSGFNIAYVGYINYKKGPMLLLHTFKAIYDKDHRYKLFIAGQFQDDRDVLYFNQMIKAFGIEKNVFYEGWKDNLDLWLEDKNYILCTSILESQNMSVMQAMTKGIKPLIHNFVGAKTIYNNNYIWSTINEAISILEAENYNSKEYFEFIKNNYSIEREINSLKELLKVIKTN